MDLVWAYGQRCCWEQLFRDQKFCHFQLESSSLNDPERIDRVPQKKHVRDNTWNLRAIAEGCDDCWNFQQSRPDLPKVFEKRLEIPEHIKANWPDATGSLR